MSVVLQQRFSRVCAGAGKAQHGPALSSDGMRAALLSNYSASAGFTSGIGAHLLSTVVVGISRRDFSNPHFSNRIAYGNACKPVKMFSFSITRGCRGSSSVHTWLFACSSTDSTTSVRLMT